MSLVEAVVLAADFVFGIPTVLVGGAVVVTALKDGRKRADDGCRQGEDGEDS